VAVLEVSEKIQIFYSQFLTGLFGASLPLLCSVENPDFLTAVGDKGYSWLNSLLVYLK